MTNHVNQSFNLHRYICLSIASPVIANIFVLPIDNVNTFLKVNHQNIGKPRLLNAAKQIVRDKGWLGLYRGCLLMSMLQFTMNGGENIVVFRWF
jgi:hypothetical protein